MKILVSGDWHGNIKHVKKTIIKAIKYDCDVIMQLGDFGYYDNLNDGLSFIDKIEEYYGIYNIPIWFIDGNHECFTHLSKLNTISEIRKGLFYVPRGETWIWDNIKFMGFGGSFSVNREYMEFGKEWFKEETPTNEQLSHACNKGKIDVLFSHDCPDGVDIMGHLGVRKKIILDALYVRETVRKLIDSVNPSHVFHGHWHVRYKDVLSTHFGDVNIEGISCDESRGGRNFEDSWTILDTEILKIDSLHEVVDTS